MIRTLQQHAVAQGHRRLHGVHHPAAAQGRRPHLRRLRLLARERQVRRCSRPRRSCWPPAASARPARSRPTPGSTPATASRWRCEAGADLIDMEFVQFHPDRDGLAAQRARHPGHRGRARRRRHAARTPSGERFMFDYIPEFFRAETADTEEEADAWYEDKTQPPHARPAAARRGGAGDQLRGEGRPGHAARRRVPRHRQSRRDADYIKRRLPSMYHQFKELADVDITKEPMEVGPTCHYMMGGVRVDADTSRDDRARAVRGRRGRRPGCTAPTAWAATRCPTCWSSAGGPACTPPSTRTALTGSRAVDAAQVEAAARRCSSRSNATGGENPYTIHADLQELHAEPGRHHPHRSRAGAGARRASRELKERAGTRARRGQPPVQPGLAPGARPRVAC